MLELLEVGLVPLAHLLDRGDVDGPANLVHVQGDPRVAHLPLEQVVVTVPVEDDATTELGVTAEEADGGIILTASHNPKQWNALKLLNEKVEPEFNKHRVALADLYGLMGNGTFEQNFVTI